MSSPRGPVWYPRRFGRPDLFPTGGLRMKAKRVPWAVLAVVALAVLWWGLRPRGSGPLPAAAAGETLTAAADNLGYGAALEAELKKIGPITPQEFGQRYAVKAAYVPQLSWDPTTATFWDRFTLDPSKPGLKLRVRGEEERQMRAWARAAGKPIPDDEPIYISAQGSHDFRLNAKELAKFRQNGFVVSERLGAASCTEMFYRIYKRDLPVFISSDAVLHAWHRSYDAILEEVETAMLMPALDEILRGMAEKVRGASQQYGAGLMHDSLTDADYFLAVARSLLAGQPVESVLGQKERVAKTLQACDRQQLEKFDLFGRKRDVDFSQFKPRGHYEKSEELKRYFKAMMWCGRTDLRVAGNPKVSSPREMAAAVVLHDLLRQSGKFERWQQFDRMLQTFVGQADSMTFAQLGVVLAAAGIRSPADVKDEATLAALQQRVEQGKFGAQEIRGDVFIMHPSDPRKFVLPRSFTLLGQRFAVDSWVTAKVVYDDIKWDEKPVMRRIPSALDVAFAALGNDQVVPELVGRMKDGNGRKFRDGLN